MLTLVLRLCGQVSGLPKGVDDQSYACIKAAISPSPLKNEYLANMDVNLAMEIISNMK